MPQVTIGEAIKAKRLGLYYSQDDLARCSTALGSNAGPKFNAGLITKSDISQMERGLIVEPAKVCQVCYYLKIDLGEETELERLEDGLRKLNDKAAELKQQLDLIEKQRAAFDMSIRFLKGEE